MSLRYLFEDYGLDTDRRELRHGGELVSLEPQVFDLLNYLVRHRDRVVSKDDLLTAVWNGRIVSESAVTTRINAARIALGDSGAEQRLIRTLRGKGLRFVGAVREVSAEPRPAGLKPINTPDECAREAAPQLSIVVLPFANLSHDPNQEYFVDGVTESLTTDLSRIAGSFVIARNTAFTFKGKAIDAKQVGRELNVRYALEGSVQRGSNRLRVNVQLIDAETGNHLWAERFDKPIADLFDIQDEIVSRLANTLDTKLIEAEARRAQRSPHPDAMELYFQGRTCLNKGNTAAYLEQARAFFVRALALDPNNVEALIGTAHVDRLNGAVFLADDRGAHLAAAETSLTKALSIVPQHARAHWHLGHVKIFSNRVVQGIAECEQALALDRNLASAHASIGVAKYLLARSEETEGHVLEALRLSPRDTEAYVWMMFAGFAKLHLGADEEAVIRFRRSIDLNRNHPRPHFYLAAALAHLGRLDEANIAVRAGLALNPIFTLRSYRASPQSNDPGYLARRERVHEGMRIAGVPEG